MYSYQTLHITNYIVIYWHINAGRGLICKQLALNLNIIIKIILHLEELIIFTIMVGQITPYRSHVCG